MSMDYYASTGLGYVIHPMSSTKGLAKLLDCFPRVKGIVAQYLPEGRTADMCTLEEFCGFCEEMTADAGTNGLFAYIVSECMNDAFGIADIPNCGFFADEDMDGNEFVIWGPPDFPGEPRFAKVMEITREKMVDTFRNVLGLLYGVTNKLEDGKVNYLEEMSWCTCVYSG